MSDFDREAERERLREKYEQDQKKRASTQRMSELLLRGATMTDSHCDDCGDPIFRYEGEEFCATCEAEGSANGESVEQDDAQSAEDRAGAAQTQEQGQAPQNRTGDRRATAERTRPTAGERTRDALANGTPTQGAEPSTSTRSDEEQSAPSRRETVDDATADLSEARASLVRAATRFARRAEAADHPSEAVDHLAAAREAAEALAALDRR